MLWEAAIPRGSASSPLVHDGVVALFAGRLMAFGADSGKRLWQSKTVRGRNGSPALWTASARPIHPCCQKWKLRCVTHCSESVDSL